MADVTIIPIIPTEETPKKPAKAEKRAARPKTSHPTTAIMVNNAINNLKERGGSSLKAMKKYISSTYKIDAEKFSPFIKKYLKTSILSGELVQTKGKGASGSFKLASAAVTKKSAGINPRKPLTRKVVVKPKVKLVLVKQAPLKKTVAKITVKPKKTIEKKPVPKTIKTKLPSKSKRTVSAPTKKPKSPKPKTTKPRIARKVTLKRK